MHQCLLSTHSVSHLVSIWQKEKFIHLKLRITNDSIDSFKQYIIDNYHKSHEIFYNYVFSYPVDRGSPSISKEMLLQIQFEMYQSRPFLFDTLQ